MSLSWTTPTNAVPPPPPSSISRPHRPEPPAKWGAACAQCAVAKAKCLRPAGSTDPKCESMSVQRCRRLGKDCTEKIRGPRKRRENKPSKTAQLEERLNSLIRALQGSNDITATPNRLSIDETSPSSQATTSGRSPETYASTPSRSTYITIPPSYNSFGPSTCICRPPPGQVPGPLDSDATLLSIYQDSLTPAYPFVVVPHGTSPADLAATRPFTMSCIRMVASFRSLRSMQGQMYRLKAHVADAMILRSERSLDLLAGLVIMLGWHHHHCFVHAQMQNLVALAVTQAAELGLTRSPGYQERTKLLVENLGEVRERTSEQKRLLLAVWYLSSTISIGMGQIEAIKFTPYMRRCLRELEMAQEFDSDTYLAYLIRIQALSSKIISLSQRNDEDEEELELVPRAPFAAYASAFDAELNNLIKSMPPRLQEDKLMRLTINTVRLRIHEPPKLDAALLSSLSKSSIAAGTPSPLDSFYQSNAALRAWFDEWLSQPIPSYPYITLPVSLNVIHAITILGRWAKLLLIGDLRRPRPSASAPAPDPPHDPSGNYNNPSPLDSATTPGTTSSTLTGTSSLSSAASSTESQLAQAIATLKIQLATQPALSLDVPGILGQMGSAMEQAAASLAVHSEDPPGVGHNIWSLTAAKLRIAQLKIEQWAAMVAEEEEEEDESGGEEEEEEGVYEGVGAEVGQDDMQGVIDGAAVEKTAVPFVGTERDLGIFEDSWGGGNPMAGAFDNLGPFSWMDGVGDWGAAMMGSAHQNG
ncbi:arsenate reductase [Colletotrichum camelliae]|nr:arsenate reductase [Colletotrichum camelliae]